ncbi:hypothetical protein DAPPUDRAFT_113300 [Daphnia pulex]|uniref:Uncharacterized protein n=1 Tax=Daphnia pulex TaxID=6669 RepID=E9HEN2_DAPPU|nr:hypothetical protein DAPPUDRAFT_113300 [Daphnia pulex]|eukprot:EFX69815.1 hypothetical protein DAPPUDRAFT_113300 [Daphnia pulex]
MATAQDAIDAVAAVGNRIDLMEAGHTNITTQLATITQQLANLIGAPPPPPGPGPGIPAPQPSTRRRLDPSTMEKLHGDASTSLLRSWRNRWDDYAALNQMTSYPAAEQMAALRIRRNIRRKRAFSAVVCQRYPGPRSGSQRGWAGFPIRHRAVRIGPIIFFLQPRDGGQVGPPSFDRPEGRSDPIRRTSSHYHRSHLSGNSWRPAELARLYRAANFTQRLPAPAPPPTSICADGDDTCFTLK